MGNNMKYMKIVVLMALGLELLGCDNINSKEAEQDFAIKYVKKQLPIVYDENTTLVDISKNNDLLIYKYDIKNIDGEDLKSPEAENLIRKDILELYCSDDKDIAQLKKAFSNGMQSDYYINNEMTLSITIKPTDCKK